MRTKKIVTTFCVLFTLSCVVIMTSGCADESNSNSNNYATYSNSEHGYTIEYPKNWEMMETTSRVTFKNNETNALANVAVLSMSSLGATSLEEVVDSYGTPGGEYTTFNGYEAYEKIVSDPVDMDTRDVFFIAGDRLFTLGYISFQQNEDDIETMNTILGSITVE